MNDDQITNEQELQAQLEQCQKERDEYLSGWQRAKADFVNYKREEQQRLAEIAKYGAADLMRELLMVLDSFDLAIMALSGEKEGPESQGLQLIKAQVNEILKRYGLEKIPISPGDAYDPAIAEAIAEVVSDVPESAVAEVVEAGYRLHGKLLRPARVKLSKGHQ